MGACFSSNQDLHQQTANVVSPTGELHRFETPVNVADVLRHLSETSSFLSNSDKLSYDDQIPTMKPNDELSENQIYFLFPSSALHRRLSASDMATLAVKASLALTDKSSPVVSLSSSNKLQVNNNNKTKNNKKSKNKISPYMELVNGGGGGDEYYNYATVKSGGQARVGSLRKLQRYSSKRAKLAVRSFRRNLSTIHEGSVAQFF